MKKIVSKIPLRIENQSFGVLHILKYKGSLGAIGAHIDRTHIPEHADPHKTGFNEDIRPGTSLKLIDILGTTIDKHQSALNQAYTPTNGQNLEAAVWARIQEGHRAKSTIRRDAVLALGIILSGSHERMLAIQSDPTLFPAWKKANYDFACKTFGKENIVRFTLHLDEKTPHFHCVVVPIVPSGRLSATHFVDGRARLIAYQDSYAQAMAPFGLGRGIPKTLTHRVHITTQEHYKSVQSLVRETDQLTESIKATNVFKLEQVRQQIRDNLVKLKVSHQEKAHQLSYAQTTNQSLVEGQEKRIYQQQSRQTSNRAYEWIKRSIPLIPFATTHLGWEIDKQRSNDQEVLLKHPTQGSIIAATSPKARTGHWVYAHVADGGGTLIDLLIKADWSWKKIQTLAHEEGYDQARVIGPGQFDKTNLSSNKGPGDNTIDPTKTSLQKQPHLDHTIGSTHHPLLSKQYSNDIIDSAQTSPRTQHPVDRAVAPTHHPLLSKRSIEKATYQGLNGLKVNEQAVIFWLYKGFSDKVQGQLCGSIAHYGNRLDFQKSLPRGLSILSTVTSLESAKQFVITESPIEALSYRQLALKDVEGWRKVVGNSHGAISYHPNDTVYLSTCGNLTGKITLPIKKELESVFQLAYKGGQPVVIALSNDQAGKKMTESLVHLAQEVGARYQVEIPTKGRNWNGSLIQPLDKTQGESFTTLPGVEKITLKLATNNSIQVRSEALEKTITGSLQADQQQVIKAPLPDLLSPMDALPPYQSTHQKHTPSSNYLTNTLSTSNQTIDATSPAYGWEDRPSSLQQSLAELLKETQKHLTAIVQKHDRSYSEKEESPDFPPIAPNQSLDAANVYRGEGHPSPLQQSLGAVLKEMEKHLTAIVQKNDHSYSKEKSPALAYRYPKTNTLGSSLITPGIVPATELDTKQSATEEPTMTKKRTTYRANL